jgi:glucose/arabinose dehydrogenase/PKD repeat protein
MPRAPKRTRLAAVAALGLLLLTTATAAAPEAKPRKDKKKNGPPLATQFDQRTLASGFRRPITFDFLPDGNMLVGEKAGLIYLVNADGEASLLLDISAQVVNERERGLEGIEVASDFATSRRVYLTYAFDVNPQDPPGPQALRVSYITLNPNDTLANPAAPETVVLGKDATGPCPAISNTRDCPPSRAATHQGGTVLSAADGTLFVGFGDSNLPEAPGKQVFRTYNPASTAGKLLHVDANGNGLPKHPFCRRNKDLTDTCTKIFARGLRNPFRFTLTPGGTPIAGDVGWTLKEEIDLVRPGRNYGWPCFEGTSRTPFYREQRRCQNAYAKSGQFTKPIFEYRNNDKLGGAAVIMGPFYPGGAYPRKLQGSYFFGDYAERFIKSAKLRKGRLRKPRTVATDVFPVQFRLAPDGNLAFVDFLGGTVTELVYAPNHAPTARAAASPDNGPTPLMVNFSSAGTTDPEGDALTYDWDFGDGSPHSSSPNPTHTYVGPDATRTARLRVSDGISTSTASVRIFVGNSAPSATVFAPVGGSSYRDGQTVSLSATGSDPDDGALPASAFSWDVLLVHKDHRHTLGTFTGNQTAFQTVTDHDADSFYEITLTVTDSEGLSTTLPKNMIVPQTVLLRIRSNLEKLRLSYAGRTVKTPEKLNSAIGFRASLAAPARVVRDGATYRFKRWSQGGRRVQTLEVPAAPTTVRAVYKKANGGG